MGRRHFYKHDLKETVLKTEKEISSIMTEIFEIELSKDSKKVAVYIAGYVANRIKKHLKCHVCNNKIISHDNPVKNLKTLSRGGIIAPCTSFKDFVCQTFSILELVSLKIIQ